jgi:hypothetical protein
MKIVYLIGNGFDINIGMETRYRDFCKYYVNLPEERGDEIIKQFKNEVGNNPENWSDLEFALGKYLENVEKQDAIILHDDLIDKLSKYIELEEEKYVINDTQRELLFRYLSEPFSNDRFLNNELIQIQELITTKGMDTDWEINIITYNYTSTIERMIGDFNEPIKIGTYKSNSIYLTGIEHIHGFSNERMILGVNDVTQIANENLRTETGVINRYIKTSCNDTYGTNVDTKCQYWLENANLVCLFGLSIGDTDKKWWQKLGNTLMDGGKILIFEHYTGKKPNANQGPARSEIMENIKDKFLSKFDNVNENLKNAWKKKIFVTYNDDMFKFEIDTKEIYNSRF